MTDWVEPVSIDSETRLFYREERDRLLAELKRLRPEIHPHVRAQRWELIDRISELTEKISLAERQSQGQGL